MRLYLRSYERPMTGGFRYSRLRHFIFSGGGLNRAIRQRSHWNDRACGSRRQLVVTTKRKQVQVDNDPQLPTARKHEGILKTEHVDLHLVDNRTAHHTDDYEVDNLVLRRGQAFEITVTFNREFNDVTDDVKFIFQAESAGDSPKLSKGTEAHVPVTSDTLKTTKWGARQVGQNGNEVTYQLMTPADAIIDEWTLIVQTVFEKKADDKYNRFRFKVKDTVYVLFNAWCKEDTVYMENEADRQEYVMEQRGQIWRGSANRNSPMVWNYKQFDDVCLDGSLYLLKKSGLSDTARGNPIHVCRTLGQMANSNDDDGGVLSGNWSGNYAGGTAPTLWHGSGSIMEQFMRTKKDVKYAQCWVFSGLLTTLCRSVGIPTRSVTNFESAHDTDGSMTIDKHFTFNNDGELERCGDLDDSVWNFHVWNESYFKRPDLPDGFDGWQAHDSTPQEVSEGMMRCGPAPVAAIKSGDVHLGYDTKFVFAEVNGDRVTWLIGSDGDMIPEETIKDSVGKQISTKAVGRNGLNDVTDQYKHPEGSQKERDAVAKALKFSSRKELIKVDTSKADCSMTLDVNVPTNGDVVAKVVIKNNSNEERNVNLTLSAVASYYTGLTGEDVKKETKKVTIPPKGDDLYEMNIPAREWINTIDADANLKMFATGRVQETKQVMAKETTAFLDKPELEVVASSSTVTAGEEFEVTASFTNPLEIPITSGMFGFEGPGDRRAVDVEAQKSIAPGETVSAKATFTPRFPGKREVVVGFNSRQLCGITGAVSVVSKRK